MNNLKITIVTPSYNQGEFIERTILSVINQDYQNYEYIICDGGSSDGTVDIIKKYEDKITYWCSEKDKGQTDAINKGMRRATGDIVCWINSDDVLLPHTLSIVASYYTKHPDCEFLNGQMIEIDKMDKIIKCPHYMINKWLFKHGAYNISQQGMFWKRSIFQNIGYLNDSFHAMMDAEFLIRVLENNYKIHVIDKALGAIRVYSGTKTSIGGSIWDNDISALKKMYNGKYFSNSYSIYFVIFIIIKIFNGCYLKKYYQTYKYKGIEYKRCKLFIKR